MKYDIKAIETLYKNRYFRSRLEANWAAFFDLMQWDWEYEPFDLNGWLPDFVVTGKRGEKKSLLVEIKPYNFGQGKNQDEFFEDYKRICRAMPEHSEFLFLGLAPYEDPNYNGDACIGKIVQQDENDILIDDGVINKNTEGSGYDVCDSILSYAYRLSGYYEGNKNPEDFDQIDKFWGMAKRNVQYQKGNK